MPYVLSFQAPLQGLGLRLRSFSSRLAPLNKSRYDFCESALAALLSSTVSALMDAGSGSGGDVGGGPGSGGNVYCGGCVACGNRVVGGSRSGGDVCRGSGVGGTGCRTGS
jgi:hypothetical protein